MKALLLGMLMTLRHFFKRSITVRYPEERLPLPPRFRGRPTLKKNDEGAPLCVACGLCEKACPAQCITIATDKGPDGKRRLQAYTVDLTRCIFCGYCTEACTFSALEMGKEFELATPDKASLVIRITRPADPAPTPLEEKA